MGSGGEGEGEEEEKTKCKCSAYQSSMNSKKILVLARKIDKEKKFPHFLIIKIIVVTYICEEKFFVFLFFFFLCYILNSC